MGSPWKLHTIFNGNQSETTGPIDVQNQPQHLFNKPPEFTRLPAIHFTLQSTMAASLRKPEEKFLYPDLFLCNMGKCFLPKTKKLYVCSSQAKAIDT